MTSVRNLISGMAVLGVGLSLAVVGLAPRSEPRVTRRPTLSPAPISGAARSAEAIPAPAPTISAEIPATAPAAPDALNRFLAALDRAEDGRALEILENSTDLLAALAPDVRDRLLRACRGGHSAPLRAALIYQLAMVDLESLRATAPEIVRFDPEPDVRRAAIQIAAELRGDDMRRAILDAFADAVPAVRADAVSALACLKDEDPAAFDRVAAALRAEPDAPARGQMAQALASLDDARVDPLLRELGLASAGGPAPGPNALLVH